mmetsp:Transcript_44687/g.82791  ORF Transcript_44687/g.82791 Transcript_44687/m.82791 type:complete len:217 (+) Transcript_44687:568-1218(+)
MYTKGASSMALLATPPPLAHCHPFCLRSLHHSASDAFCAAAAVAEVDVGADIEDEDEVFKTKGTFFFDGSAATSAGETLALSSRSRRASSSKVTFWDSSSQNPSPSALSSSSGTGVGKSFLLADERGIGAESDDGEDIRVDWFGENETRDCFPLPSLHCLPSNDKGCGEIGNGREDETEAVAASTWLFLLSPLSPFEAGSAFCLLAWSKSGRCHRP